MKDAPHIAICCDVTERPAWNAATALLNRSFDQTDLITLQFANNLEDLPTVGAHCRAISLLPFVLDSTTPWPTMRTTLETTCAEARAQGVVFVTTVFRCLDDDIAPPEHRAATMLRLRRLNLLATELSRALDLSVIDLDRVLADVGAERLEADARLGSPAATALAAETIAWTILDNAADDWAAPDRVAAARQGFAALRVAPPTARTAATPRPRRGDGRPAQAAIRHDELLNDASLREILNDVFHSRMSLSAASPKLIAKFAARLRLVLGRPG